VDVFGATVDGTVRLSGTTGDTILAGTTVGGSLTLTGNAGSKYGVGLVGNRVGVALACEAIDPGVTDFGPPNTVAGAKSGQCGAL
jgi:hypothetical protein